MGSQRTISSIRRRRPAWWDRVNAKYKRNPEKMRLVRRVWELAADGYGDNLIVKKLRADKVPTITGMGKWNRGYVAKILRTDFEWSGIERNLYDRAKSARQARRRVRGRSSPEVTNLFSGKIYIYGRKAYYKHANRGSGYLYPDGEGDKTTPNICIPYVPLERCILEWMREASLYVEGETDKLSALYAKKESLEAKRDRVIKEAESARISRELTTIDAEMKEVKSDPVIGGLFHTAKLVAMLQTTKDKEKARRSLRQQISLLVERIDIEVPGYRKRQSAKWCDITVSFVNGEKRCLYMRAKGHTLEETGLLLVKGDTPEPKIRVHLSPPLDRCEGDNNDASPTAKSVERFCAARGIRIEDVELDSNMNALLMLMDKIEPELEQQGLRKNGKMTKKGVKKLKEDEERHQKEIRNWVRKNLEGTGHFKNGKLTEKGEAEIGLTAERRTKLLEDGMVKDGKLTEKARAEFNEETQALLAILLHL